MLERKIEKRMLEFFQEPHHKALLITGARQVGKTYSIRKFGQQNFVSFLEINFLENQSARQLFTQANKAQELLLRLSALVDGPMLPGKTLIFFDEVQECPEIVTAIKFLVEEGSYRYILSGSLLGVGLQDIRSLPVGYMDVWEMFPLDLEEFATSQQVSPQTLAYLNTCYVERRPVDHLVHQQMLNLFHLYLVVGGMPAVVQSYVDTNNLRIVSQEQEAIINWYKQDIGKYDPDNKLYLEAIFQLIPAELNNQNKRFILKNLNENFKFSRYANSFIWLEQAGVALPAYAVNEPAYPLLLHKSANLFKLFLSDVGLLAVMYGADSQLEILKGNTHINFGSIYENICAQELRAHGFELYYFQNKKQGEVDFLLEEQGKLIPIEVKSGKAYQRHASLDRLMNNPVYDFEEAFVLSSENVGVIDRTCYLPIYMLMFIQKKQLPENFIYQPNLSALT